jgi:hypothetical protein
MELRDFQWSGGGAVKLIPTPAHFDSGSLRSSAANQGYLTQWRGDSKRGGEPGRYNGAMLTLLFAKPPLPGWAWVVLLIGGAVAVLIDRLRHRR